MKGMEWDDSLSIGIELIDEQHKTWIGHLKDVATALQTQQGPARITKTLGFLIDYTQHHFATEEKQMTATAYPALGEHRAKHGELKVTLDGLMEDFDEEGATQRLARAIDTFLSNWLVKHIHDVDQSFGDYLREKGISLAKED